MRAALLPVVLSVFAFGCGSTPTTLKTDYPPPKVEPKKDEPKAPGEFPPSDWTHKELASYLAQKGIKVEVRPLLRNLEGRIAAGFAPVDGPKYTEALVYLCSDAKRAREEAGAMGNAAFAKGRFAFGPGASGGGGVDVTPGAAEVIADNEAFLKKLAAALK